jgi:hypothetical protein
MSKVNTKFLFRFRFEEAGGHTHVRLFAGLGASSLGLCGPLVFRNDEWSAFVAEVNREKAGTTIEFLPEGLEALHEREESPAECIAAIGAES